MIRVSIVAESAIVARGLASLVADDGRFEIVETQADVLLASGIGAADAPPDAPVVLLTDEPVEAWDHAGPVHAWLPFHSTPEDIVAALVAASRGLSVLTAAQTAILFDRRASRQRTAALLDPLTSRELQVLRLMAEGLANKEIAAQLGISDHTVKFHVTSILSKLHAATRAEAVALGIRQGLVPI